MTIQGVLATTIGKFRVAAKRPSVRRAGAAAGFGLLAGGVILSLVALPPDLSLARPEYLVLIAVIGVPLMILTNTWETRLSAQLLGRNFSWRDSLRIATIASAANVLPLPGGAVVRVAALKGAGASLADSGSVTLAIALVWFGAAFAYAGAWLVGWHWLAWPFLMIGASALGASLLWLFRLADNWQWPLAILGVKAASVAAGLLRMAWALMALGVGFDMAGLSVFAVSGVSGAAVSIVPAGLGVTESVAAALATAVAIPASAAFLAATIVRAIGLAVQCPIALWVALTAGGARGMYYPFRIAAVLAGAAARVTPRPRKWTVILATSLEGSQGDAAMLDAAVSQMADKGPLMVLCYKRNERHARLIRRYGVHVVSLEFLLTREPWQFLRLLSETKTFRFIGADVIDGVYGARNALLRLCVAECFARSGADAAIIGCSYSTKPDPDCLAMLRGMPTNLSIVVRDPESRRRLESATGRRFEQGADLAFLMRPDATGIDQTTLDWIERARAGQLIGFGVNALLHDPENPDVVGAIAGFLKSLLAVPERHVVLVAHDVRATVSDLRLSERVHARLPAELQPRVRLISEPYAPWQLKFIAGQTEAMISARMHFAIAGLSQGVPVFGLRYQGKFEGLYDLLGIADLPCLADASQLRGEPAQVLCEVERFLDALPTIRQRLKLHLPAVVALSRRNIFSSEAPSVTEMEKAAAA